MQPENVTSPEEWNHTTPVSILWNSGGWSVVEGTWNEEPRLAIRWNGNSNNSIGFPKNKQTPLWFALPSELTPFIRLACICLRGGWGGLEEE